MVQHIYKIYIMNSYFENHDTKCRSVQQWSKVIEKLETNLGVTINTTTGFENSQPSETRQAIESILHALDPFTLIAVETQTRLFKSVLLPLALRLQLIDLPFAIDCALAESEIQASKWGSIPENHCINRAGLTRSSAIACLIMQ